MPVAIVAGRRPEQVAHCIEEVAADIWKPQRLVAQPFQLGRECRRLGGVAVTQLCAPDPDANESLRHGRSLPPAWYGRRTPAARRRK
jgi:hypothetical protein